VCYKKVELTVLNEAVEFIILKTGPSQPEFYTQQLLSCSFNNFDNRFAVSILLFFFLTFFMLNI